jgi:hypothetical protein
VQPEIVVGGVPSALLVDADERLVTMADRDRGAVPRSAVATDIVATP